MLSRICSTAGIWAVLVALLIGPGVVTPAGAVEAGMAPPDFVLATLDGKPVHLSDYRGKPIILKLATTWCPSCKQQVKELDKIAPFLAEHEVALIEVFVDEPEEAVRDYLQTREFRPQTIPLLDDGQVARAYRIYTIPRLLLIDREFKVVRDRGLMTAADLQGRLQEVLGD